MAAITLLFIGVLRPQGSRFWLDSNIITVAAILTGDFTRVLPMQYEI